MLRTNTGTARARSVAVLLSLIVVLGCGGKDDKKKKHTCPAPPTVTVCHLPSLAKDLGVDLSSIQFEPKDVLYRHAAQLNMVAMRGAKQEYRRKNPTCPYSGPRLLQSKASPPCPKKADFTASQLSGLRVAQGVHQGAPRWWDLVPDCPCLEKDVPSTWKGGAASQTYHPGAKRCYRSPPVKKSVVTAAGLDASRVQPGQQCCYDASKTLITEGAGAGTPDIYAPEDFKSFVGHSYIDVEIFNLLGWRLYTMYWPPNNDNDCKKNKKP